LLQFFQNLIPVQSHNFQSLFNSFSNNKLQFAIPIKLLRIGETECMDNAKTGANIWRLPGSIVKLLF